MTIFQNSTWALFIAIVSMAPLAAYARNGMALMPFILAMLIFFRYGFTGLSGFDKSIFIPTFMLFAWGLASSLWSAFPDPIKAPALALTALAGVVAILAPKKMSDDDIRHYVKAIGLLGIASAILFAIQYAFDFPLIRLASRNFINGSADGNIVPIAMLIYPIGVALYLEHGRKAAGVLFVAAMLILVSTGPMFAAAVAVYVGTLLFASSYYFPKSTIACLFSLLIVYFAVSPIVHSQFATIERVSRLPVEVHQSWAHRLGIWTFSSKAALDHPILGVGLRGARHLGQGQVIEGTNLPVMSLHPHNAAIQIWLELGLVGVLLVIAVSVGLARLLWRICQNRLLVALSCASIGTFVTIGCLSFGVWQTWWHGTLWVTAYVISVLGRRLNLAESGPVRMPAA